MSVKTFTAIKYAAGFAILAGCLVVNAGCGLFLPGIIDQVTQQVNKEVGKQIEKNLKLPEESSPSLSDKPFDQGLGNKRSVDNFQSAPKKNTVAKVKVKSTRAEIKEKPSPKSKSIASINMGEEAEKLGQEKNWLRVRYTANNSEVEGWILKCHCDGFPKCPNPVKNKKPETNKNFSPI
jgi:hypothetical protein